jgi:RAD50-interacting protein 1
MTYTEVKDCTSEAVGSQDEGSVFDVAINDFESLRNKAETLIINALKYKFPANFSQYLSKPEWQTIYDAPLSSKLIIWHLVSIADFQKAFLLLPSRQSLISRLRCVICPILHPSVSILNSEQILQRNLGFLHRTLANALFKRICRESLESLERLLFDDVLLRQEFSTLGAARFMQDIAAIQGVVDSCMPRGSTSALGMLKLKEAAALLNLPVEAEEGRMPLKEAGEEIYAGGVQAKEVLENLGMTRLTIFEARSILGRRLEIHQD